MTYIVKTDYLDVPTDSHTASEVTVKTTTSEYHEGDEVDLSAMDPARVAQLEAAGAIEPVEAAKKREKEAAEKDQAEASKIKI